MSTITLPKFSLLEKSEGGCHAECAHCGRELKNFYVVRNNESKETFTLGSGCVQKYCGKTPAKIQKENDDFEKAVIVAEQEEQLASARIARMTHFKEVEADVWEYILNNAPSNSFLEDMRVKVLEQGTIPENALKAIRVMMIPFAEIEKGTKVEGTFEVLQFVVDAGEDSYTGGDYIDVEMWVRGEDGNKFKVKTSYSKTNCDFVDQVVGITRHNRTGGSRYWGAKFYPEFGTHFINVSGKFDGWKVTRAKITLKEVE